MKKLSFLSVAFALLSLGLQAQNPYSYYYKGEKINLVVDKSCVNIVANPEFLQSDSADMLFEILQLERGVPSVPNVHFVKLKFQSELTLQNYDSIVVTLQNHPQITKVLPFFENGDEPIGTSDVFYIELKTIGDTALLRTFTEQHNVEIVKRSPYMPLWAILSLKNSAFNNSLEATNFFYESGLFADIDPAFMFNFRPHSYPNDPQYAKLWGLDSKYGINASDAWAISQGAGIKVGVVDQGIDFSHNDLTTNIYPLSYNAQDSTSPSVFDPNYSHGLHVAGIIAAVKDNNLQVVGVAPESKIMGVSHPIAITLTASAELAEGISWAWQNGADIINCSWGMLPDISDQNYQDFKSPELEKAIINALTLGRGGKGTVVVFSAGNSGSKGDETIDYPGNFCDSILVVGATNIFGERGSFSGIGKQLDVTAPGVDILSTVPNNEIDYMDGTSMAAPHVSGIAALMLSANPDLTRQEVCDIIERTARKVRPDVYNYRDTILIIDDFGVVQDTLTRLNGTFSEYTGYGLVDAYASVLLAARNEQNAGVLLIRDTLNDVGHTPTNISDHTNSPDIWVRRTENTDSKVHQEPCIGTDTSYINVRVRNAGWHATQGSEMLHIHVRRTDSASLWDGTWQGIASYPLPALRPGQDTIFEIPYLFQNAAAFSILAFVDTVLAISANIEDLVKNSSKIAMKNVVLTDRLDLGINDHQLDLGDEPFINFEMQDFSSPYIWYRNNPNDENTAYDYVEIPVPDSAIYIHFRIWNNGCVPSTPTDSVKLYWAKSETSLAWDSCWNGNRINGNGPLLGNCIGTYPIPTIHKDRRVYMEVPWNNPPNPTDYKDSFYYPWDFQVLLRIVSNEDTMTFPETTNVIGNIRNNNNITGRNLTIGYVDLIIRDDENDTGIEPNPNPDLQNSCDIWVRRSADSIEEHQDALNNLNATNYIYVRIKNIGTTFSRGNEELHLHWASTPEKPWYKKKQWPPQSEWIDNEIHPVDTLTTELCYDPSLIRYIPSLLPGEEVIMEIPWLVPNDYHASVILLARIISDKDSITNEVGNVAENVKNNNNIAWKKVYITNCSEKFDLMIKDNANDDGSEPNTSTNNLFDSPSIWVRHIQDNDTIHQNPIPNRTNYIYVKIHKLSGIIQPNVKLKMYWAKGGTNLTWDSCWSGKTFPGSTALLGDFIGSVPIPPIACLYDTVLAIPWNNVPDYLDYCGLIINPNYPPNPNNYHNPYDFYLLAVIESELDPLNLETKHIDSLVRYNNNVAMKHINLARKNLLIRDFEEDDGTEPSSTTEIISNSPDIWVVNPCGYGDYWNIARTGKQSNVYIQIENIGCTTTPGNEVLKLYWGKTTDTNMTWSSHWTLIDSIPIPNLPSTFYPNGVCTLQIPWVAPSAAPYYREADPFEFCLLARIEEGDTISLLETEDWEQNVRNNRQIAAKNVRICDKATLIIRDDENDVGGNNPSVYPWNSPDITVVNMNGSHDFNYNGNYSVAYNVTNIGDCLHCTKDSVSISIYWSPKSNLNWTLIDKEYIYFTEPGESSGSYFAWKNAPDSTLRPDTTFYVLAVIDAKDWRPTTLPTDSNIEDFIKNNSNVAGKAVSIGNRPIDLMMRDCITDLGSEPGTCSTTWESPDIWIRKKNDRKPTHENPVGNDTNYVNIRVSCIGQSASSGTEKLHLYYSKSGSSLHWSKAWDGTKLFPGTAIPMGNQIGNITIPPLLSGKDSVLVIPWFVPDPAIYSGIDGIADPFHFCLLARIWAPNTDPMSFPESSNVSNNIRNNNNIASLNVDVIEVHQGGSISGTIYVANWADVTETYCLKFQPVSTSITITHEAEVTVKLGDVLYQAWQRGGGVSQDIVVQENNTFLITGTNAKLCNLIFYPEEIGLLSVKFNFLTREKTDQEEYDFHVIQTEDEEILGGEVYHVITPPRNLFQAVAEDVYAIEGDEIALIAEDIGEPATYRWYDADGNLVCEGEKFSTIAEQETHYKLEVTAVSDGYKDYATANVRIVPGKIEEIYPNPTTDDVTIRCVFGSRVKNAYIQISDYFKAPPVGIPLNTSPQNVVVNMRTYPIGTYIVTLICDDVVVDTKTFVRH